MIVSSERTEYPINTENLVKGSRVSIREIEEAYGVRFGTDAFQLAALKLTSYLERRFRDRGQIVTVVQRKGDVVILTDAEAATENSRQFDLKVRGAARAHVRGQGVDRSQLNEGDRAVHDRNLESQGRQLSALRAAKGLPTPSAHKRQTPLPPGVKSKDDEAA
jgi:hypothetical protein